MLTARLMDRVGKGIRGAPRDALVADIAPPELRGAAFGLRQSLDTVGAFLGPLLAMALMLLWANDFRAVFWVATIPAFLAVALLFLGVQEPERQRTRTAPSIRSAAGIWRDCRWRTGGWWASVRCSRWRAFPKRSWCCARSRAGCRSPCAAGTDRDERRLFAVAPIRSASSSDRMSHAGLLALGLVVLIAADLVLACEQPLDLGLGRASRCGACTWA